MNLLLLLFIIKNKNHDRIKELLSTPVRYWSKECDGGSTVLPKSSDTERQTPEWKLHLLFLPV